MTKMPSSGDQHTDRQSPYGTTCAVQDTPSELVMTRSLGKYLSASRGMRYGATATNMRSAGDQLRDVHTLLAGGTRAVHAVPSGLVMMALAVVPTSSGPDVLPTATNRASSGDQHTDDQRARGSSVCRSVHVAPS